MVQTLRLILIGTAIKQINKSGFAFQLRVEDEIIQTEHEHGWIVASREHPWATPDTGDSGFIDIVLRHKMLSTCRMVIECKRIKADDARQLRWVFLLPDEEQQTTDLMSCFEVEGDGVRSENSTVSVWKDIRVWDNVSLVPHSLQSEFCILQNDESRRQPIVESLASEVLMSIEGLAQEEVNMANSYNPPRHLRLFIFSVIVTNAELSVCHFSSNNIKICDGTLSMDNVEISSVPFIRFRKSLATKFPAGEFYELNAANKARERSIFVVNAASLPEFLKGWQILPRDQFRKYAVQRLMR